MRMIPGGATRRGHHFPPTTPPLLALQNHRSTAAWTHAAARMASSAAVSLNRSSKVSMPGEASDRWLSRVGECSAVHNDKNRHSHRCLSRMGPQLSKQLSRLDTNPIDLLPPASDHRFLRPTSSATGLLARLCPWKDLHLRDSINRFHRGSQLTLHDADSLFAICITVDRSHAEKSSKGGDAEKENNSQRQNDRLRE